MPRAPRSEDPYNDALLLIDVINDFDFPAGDQLLKHAWPAAQAIADLKKRARAAEVPVIYVNDNFGRWRSDLQQQVDHCTQDGSPGRDLVKLLKPTSDDYFVLKPKHSGFYSTTLAVLLESLDARRLILTGFATDICVLYTANDAYMRDFQLTIPRDTTAAETQERYRFALEHMNSQLKADTRPAGEVAFGNR